MTVDSSKMRLERVFVPLDESKKLEKLVRGGMFVSKSDAIRAGLRLLFKENIKEKELGSQR